MSEVPLYYWLRDQLALHKQVTWEYFRLDRIHNVLLLILWLPGTNMHLPAKKWCKFFVWI